MRTNGHLNSLAIINFCKVLIFLNELYPERIFTGVETTFSITILATIMSQPNRQDLSGSNKLLRMFEETVGGTSLLSWPQSIGSASWLFLSGFAVVRRYRLIFPSS
jgi:hypothetical protein